MYYSRNVKVEGQINRTDKKPTSVVMMRVEWLHGDVLRSIKIEGVPSTELTCPHDEGRWDSHGDALLT